MIRFALPLALLPLAVAAQDLPTPLELVEGIEEAMLAFDPEGAALFGRMPAGPAWEWEPTEPVLVLLGDAATGPWAWAGSAWAVLRTDAPEGYARVLPGIVDCARQSVAAARRANPEDPVAAAAGNAEAMLFCQVILPVSPETTLADYDLIAAAMADRFRAVEIRLPGGSGDGWIGTDRFRDGLVAEGAVSSSGSVIDLLHVALNLPGPSGGTTVLTVTVISLLYPPES